MERCVGRVVSPGYRAVVRQILRDEKGAVKKKKMSPRGPGLGSHPAEEQQAPVQKCAARSDRGARSLE